MTASTAKTPTLAERGADMDLWPDDRGPWHDKADGWFDRGWHWCGGASYHPDNQPDEYPHPDHGPADHCWTQEYSHINDARLGIDGDPVNLRAFMVAPFRYGEPFDSPRTWDGPRLYVDFAVGDDQVAEVSMSLGDAMALVRHIDHAIEVVLNHREPRLR